MIPNSLPTGTPEYFWTNFIYLCSNFTFIFFMKVWMINVWQFRSSCKNSEWKVMSRKKTRHINRHRGGFIRPTPRGRPQFVFIFVISNSNPKSALQIGTRQSGTNSLRTGVVQSQRDRGARQRERGGFIRPTPQGRPEFVFIFVISNPNPRSNTNHSPKPRSNPRPSYLPLDLVFVLRICTVF